MERGTRYRAIWRWHFYAGLFVAPVLLMLSITGAIYLFNDEIDDLLYARIRLVEPSATRLPPSALIGTALAAYPGGASRIDMPAVRGRSAIIFVSTRAGKQRRVAVDPGTGRVLGSYVYDRTLVGMADRLHGSLMLGPMGDAVVELAACWALFLIGTGLYLWWPRGRRGMAGILYPRLRLRGRALWRDAHAVTGFWAIGLIAFLILTGLPWAGIQGDVLRRAIDGVGAGYPVSHGTYGAPSSTPMKTALGEAPWTLEAAPMPVSGHAGHGAPTGPGDAAAIAGVDGIVTGLARQHGLAGGYRLFLPGDARGVYTAYTYPDRPQGQRSLYFDRWTGALLRETRYADYGWAARAIELGVQLHMGNYFGLANQIVMLATCLAIIALVVSGVVMWWKRRPVGTFAPPPRGRRPTVAIPVLVLSALAFPLFGASLLVVATIDRLVTRRARRPA